ncbi:MAG: type II toxin-antitoxin system VapC family toxin [Pirellulales bacterium]
MIFVDTSAWFAFHSVRDVNHAAAAQAMNSFSEPLVTTDYVVDETLTLFRARGEHRLALTFGRRVIDGGSAKIVAVSNLDFADAWEVFQRFADKEWSFTDCTSQVVMQRLHIQRAFAFDDHFHQFGTVTVLP